MKTTALCIREEDFLFHPFVHHKISLSSRWVLISIPGLNLYDRLGNRESPGLIITEPLALVEDGGELQPFYGGFALREWKKIARAIHSYGGGIAPLLSYAGPAVAVNELSKSDIREAAFSYARAGSAARVLGFDAVVIDGAGSQLLGKFMREGVNKRHDEYGGDVTRRVRFAAQVVHAVRKAVGRRFPIIFRFSQRSHEAGEKDLVQNQEELREFVELLCQAGVDIFLCKDCSGENWAPLNLVALTRQISNRPVITECVSGVSNVHLPMLVRRMRAREFDLIAVTPDVML